ncbi:desmocollin-2 [Arapaima gigas]
MWVPLFPKEKHHVYMLTRSSQPGKTVVHVGRVMRSSSAPSVRLGHKMAPAAFFCIFFIYPVFCTVSSLSADSCLPPSIQAEVPGELPAGYAVSRVNLAQCGTEGLQVTTDDPDFAVQTDGTVTATQLTVVSIKGRRFLIWVQKNTGEKSQVEVTLIRKVKEDLSNRPLKRYKRRWSPPPIFIKENQRSPFPKDTEVIASDSSQNYTVYYTISGPGVTENPVHMFTVIPNRGMVQVNGPLDREEFSNITFVARVLNVNTHRETDKPLPVTVIVEDENDNAPEFTGPMQFSVRENCKVGSPVGIITATDRDDPKTPHAKIRYKLLDLNSPFFIHSTSGTITTRTNTLDRELLDRHLLIVEARDMEGDPSGLFRTATVTVTVEDMNDNKPTFSQTSYSAKVEENKANVLILRIPVEDKDLVNTDNWKARFVITKGNETGNFRVETDPKTNEGLIYVVKPFDYEKTKKVNLEVMAQNVANLEGTSDTWASVPVTVNVTDVDEGPEFFPQNLYVIVKENVANGTVIATYTAKDPETQSSKGIRYYEVSDPASWINVMENTGELKVANTIDRESSFVNNGLYNITVKAVDESKKTGTGTVMIQIEDVNDNNPEIISKDLVLCETDGDGGSVTIEAKDLDQPPFSSPFSFELGENNDGKWKLENIKDTSAMLRPAKDLPPGLYSIPVVVKDLQGMGMEQMVTVQICRCVGGGCLAARSSASLSVWGVLAMALAALLLLLLCLLCALVCNTKKDKLDIIDSSDGMLLKSNTEGPGDEVNASPPVLPTNVKEESVKDFGFAKPGGGSFGTMGTKYPGRHPSGNPIGIDTIGMYNTWNLGSLKEREFMQSATQSTMHMWKTNAIYLDKKLMYFGIDDEGRYADDIPLHYGYEGCGSPAGSVGCCSDVGAEDNLGFLDSLGPKFRTLAEVCTKK